MNWVPLFSRQCIEHWFIEANACLSMLLGLDSPQELMAAFTDIGRQHYVNPQDRVLFKKILDREGSIRAFETPLFKKDGHVLWIVPER